MTTHVLNHSEALVLRQSIIEGGFVPFLGAGISYGAGLPVVLGEDGLLPAVLDCLGLGRKQRELILSHRPPLEGLMGAIARAVPLDALIAMFELGEPSVSHSALAALAQIGAARMLYTTNFDLLLERALETRGVPYRRMIYDEDFAQTEVLAPVVIAKLHGSADQRDSVGLTLDRIANRRLGRNKSHALSTALSDPNILLCFMGYSLSDEFDLTPVMASATKNATLVLVSHRTGPAVEWLAGYQELAASEGATVTEEKFAALFSDCRSSVVRCDTDRLLRELAELATGQELEQVGSRTSPWRSFVDFWARGMDDGQKKVICTSLLVEVTEFEAALSEVATAPRTEDDLRLRGVIHHRMGKLEAAVQDYRAALAAGMPAQLEVNTRSNLARVLSEQGRHGEAQAVFGQNTTAGSELHSRVQALRGMAVSLQYMGDGARAREVAERALESASDLGDPKEEAYCSCVLARSLVGDIERWEDVSRLLEYAKRVSETVGDRFVALMALEVEGHWRQIEGQAILGVEGEQAAVPVLEKAIDLHRTALDIAEVIADKAAVARLRYAIGNSMSGINASREAGVTEMLAAAGLAKEAGNQMLEVLALQSCGEVCLLWLDHLDRGRQLLEQAMALAYEADIPERLKMTLLAQHGASLALSGDAAWEQSIKRSAERLSPGNSFVLLAAYEAARGLLAWKERGTT